MAGIGFEEGKKGGGGRWWCCFVLSCHVMFTTGVKGGLSGVAARLGLHGRGIFSVFLIYGSFLFGPRSLVLGYGGMYGVDGASNRARFMSAVRHAEVYVRVPVCPFSTCHARVLAAE